MNQNCNECCGIGALFGNNCSWIIIIGVLILVVCCCNKKDNCNNNCCNDILI